MKLVEENQKMTETTKLFHIYAKDKCLMPCVKEEDFKVTWSTLNAIVGLMQTNYRSEDLSYEEVTVNKVASEDPSY